MLASSGTADFGMGGAYMPAPVIPTHDPMSLRGLIQKSIQETAARGSVVIVSHAASFALASHDDTLRVFITAPVDVRVDRVAAEGSLDVKRAAKAVTDDDAARASYLKEFYGVSHELPSHYDLVFNTQALPQETIATLIVTAAHADR